MTEKQQEMSSLYEIKRLKSDKDIKADIVISTIQKLFAVLIGQTITEGDEDAEDEAAKADEEKNSKEVITLGSDLRLPKDYFQLIIVDECHRSIYGKWKAVLDYFSSAKVLGLTATPTPEAYAFFNNNVIEEYTYDESVVDGVNVPSRVYRITTEITEHGGAVREGTTITETSRKTGQTCSYEASERVDYDPSRIFEQEGFTLYKILEHKDIVDYYDTTLSKCMLCSDQTAEIYMIMMLFVHQDIQIAQCFNRLLRIRNLLLSQNCLVDQNSSS